MSDCERPAARYGLCWCHAKRLQRGRLVVGPLQSRERWWSLFTAALELADCDSEDDAAFLRARDRLAVAAKRYAAGG